MLGLGLDHHPGAGQAPAPQVVMELLGQGPGDEGDPVDPIDRRVQVDRHGQVGRRATDLQRGPVEAGGQSMGSLPLGPEAPDHVGRRQGGEGPEGGEAQPDQHVGQVGAAQHPDRLGSEECRTAADRHHERSCDTGTRRPCRQIGGEPAVGHPQATARVGGADCNVERHPDHLGGAGQQRRLATEQPQRPPDPEGAGTGPGHLHPRGHIFEGGDHRCEASGLRRLGALEDGLLGAAPLGLATTLPAGHPDRPGRLRGCGHPAGGQHERRVAGRHPEDGQGPVGAADDQGAGTGVGSRVHGREGTPRASGSSSNARRSRALRPRPVATTSARRHRRRP